jgi:hypothetical protein
MSDSFDYSTYSLEELRDARAHINRAAYPERAAEIDEWIRVRTEAASAEPPRPIRPVKPSRDMPVLLGCGVVAAAVIALVIIAGTILVSRGNVNDTESQRVAWEIVEAVTADWNTAPLLANASTQLRKEVNEQTLNGIFTMYRKLGARTYLKTPVGGSRSTVGFGSTPTGVTAEYVFEATFTGGPATIRINLVREGKVWKVNGFHVNSDALFTQPPAAADTSR